MLNVSLVLVLFICQTAYWLLLYRGFRTTERQNDHLTPLAPGRVPPLSVIVAARNEAPVLPRLLKALVRQTHPCHEIIVVDDGSTDATAAIVEEWAAEHANVRLVQVSDPQPPRKKRALTRGVAEARYELLAFTDADCVPPPGWLRTLARWHTSESREVLVTGYSPYRRGRGMLGRLAAYETFAAGFFTAATAGLGRPYTAVGRNISYSRRLFESVGGFSHAMDSLSGDDDLFVQAAHAHADVAVVHPLQPESFVATDPPGSWSAWLHQKQRHTSAGRFYTRTSKLHLALFHGSNVLLWTAPLWGGIGGIAALLLKLALQEAVLARAARALREKVSLPALPALEFFYMAYNLVVAPLGLAKMPKRW